MKNFKPGLVHTPVTPFHRDQSIDFDTYAKIIEFHLRNGAEALALPMPEGEDLSLTDEEQRKLLEFAIRQVKDRVPASPWRGPAMLNRLELRPSCRTRLTSGIPSPR